MVKYLVLILLVIGCSSKQGTNVEVTGAKDDFNVTLLFEKDGCKVYRFEDTRYQYFTNCTEVTSAHVESCDKSCSKTVYNNIKTNHVGK